MSNKRHFKCLASFLQTNDAFEPTLPVCLQAPFPAWKQGLPSLKIFEIRIPKLMQASLHSFLSVTSEPDGQLLSPLARR